MVAAIRCGRDATIDEQGAVGPEQMALECGVDVHALQCEGDAERNALAVDAPHLARKTEFRERVEGRED